MWHASIKWVFRIKPNHLFSTERKVNKGIDKNERTFDPKPRLAWYKGGFAAFLLFLLLSVIGMSVFWTFYNDSTEFKEKRTKIKYHEQKVKDENFDYLVRSADRAFVQADFILAKKELDIALKMYPEDVKANRLYIQTWIQLIEKYPQYRAKGIKETRESVKYLSDSKSDQLILKVFNEIINQ